MIVYTSNIRYTHPTIPLIDTTVKSGTGIGAAFAPTWDMVMGVKGRTAATLTWEQYTVQYTELMRQRYKANPAPFLNAVNMPVLCLQCYCPTEQHTHCHRSLLANILVKIARSRGLSAVYDGELPRDETHRMMLCGSRDAADELLDKARQHLSHVRDTDTRKVEIVVGDAVGVDASVIDQAYWESLPCRVYGVQDTPRCIVPASTPYFNVGGTYTQRDTLMVDLSHEVIAFWNGRSKGTQASIEYARKIGKPVTVIS